MDKNSKQQWIHIEKTEGVLQIQELRMSLLELHFIMRIQNFIAHQFWKVGAILLLLFALCSCKGEDDPLYTFIGDSEIERWDVPYYFPSWMVQNKGVGGTGIDYIRSQAGTLRNTVAIVHYGTNDNGRFSEQYCNEYVSAIASLGGDEVYLFSVMPRCFNGDDAAINSRIADFNAKVKDMAEGMGWHYIDVYPLLLKGDDINWDYYSDGLHLSAHGYELLSCELRRAMKLEGLFGYS